jgi:hypothetical protein
MKKVVIPFVCVIIILGMVGASFAAGCVTLKSGLIQYSAGHYLAGQPIKLGYDAYGYNYQAHMFNGSYANAYLGRDGFPPYTGDDAAYLAANPTAATHWTWPYRNDQVMMKWNEAWLSNQDCDGDGKLDRYYGFSSYAGSGAWETNHMNGTYEGTDGNECQWNYFVKIVAVPANATLLDGYWHAADDQIIGYDVEWGSFAAIDEVFNDKCAGLRGRSFRGEIKAGFGNW